MRRVGIAETREAMAAIARTRLAYREAAEQDLGAAKVVTEIDPREEWRYLSECALVFRLLGDEFGYMPHSPRRSRYSVMTFFRAH